MGFQKLWLFFHLHHLGNVAVSFDERKLESYLNEMITSEKYDFLSYSHIFQMISSSNFLLRFLIRNELTKHVNLYDEYNTESESGQKIERLLILNINC